MTDQPTSTPEASHNLKQANQFFISAILIALAVWPMAFDFGAYGTVFYDSLMQMVVVSLVALGAGLYVGRNTVGRPYLPWPERLVLLLPLLWVLAEVLADAIPVPLTRGLSILLSLATALLALPLIIHIMMRVTMPEATQVRNPRLSRGLVLVAVLVAASSWLVGRHNYLVFTCRDFTVSGDFEPENCWKSPDQFR